ncbi:MAG: histidinol-phosphatase HisJ family protein [Limnochordia bacterium]|jgi:histidinol-phosphatase (PHP family)
MGADYHIHTHNCGHAQGDAEAYAQWALKLGFEEICFTDHMPNFYLPADMPYQHLRRPLREMEAYLADVARAQRKFPQLKIKVGVEVDYIPGKEREIARALQQFPLDFVIGSVHFVGRWSLYDPKYYREFTAQRIYQDYFLVVREAASCGLFHTIAHLDVPKLYAPLPKGYLELARPVLEAIGKAGICLEVNCAGIRAGLGQPFPNYDLIALAYEMGLPITLGSDAHKPEQVGNDFPAVIERLQAIGYEEQICFNQGQPYGRKLSGSP